MAIVDCHNLPLAVTSHTDEHREVTLVQLTFDIHMIEVRSENLIGDGPYDSDHLDAGMRKKGTAMSAPHRFERRRTVEWFFTWIHWQSRLLAGWE